MRTSGRRSRAPLAVAGILAMPLFFAALMATSLAVEKPTVMHTVKKGHAAVVLGDPSGTTEAKIWLLAVVPSLVLALVGTLAIRVPRFGVVVTAVAAIAIAVALLVPLGTWQHRHASRFPVGVDLIPPSAGSEDIYLKGEWESNAKRTAAQLGGGTIGLAAASILVLALLEVRRRRGVLPPPPPPLELATGGAPPLTGG